MIEDVKKNMNMLQREMEEKNRNLYTKYTTSKRKFLLEGSTQIRHCTEKKIDFEDSKRIYSKETHTRKMKHKEGKK